MPYALQRLRPLIAHPFRIPCTLPRKAFKSNCFQKLSAKTYFGTSSPYNLPGNPGPSGPEAETQSDDARGKDDGWGPTIFKMVESSVTTLMSVAILGLVGFSYTRYYKHLVLRKIENAFQPGDPVLALAAEVKGSGDTGESTRIHWIDREEQTKLDNIINGTDQGRYYLVVGEKGNGKTSMVLEAMRKIDGEGVSMFEAHADLEIFRIRLGRALDFEYHEDNIGSLFSIRGPRDASALLDIERAFNKLEKVALQRRAAAGKPLVLIINSMHLVRDDDDGRDLLELIQQRAEQWAAANLCTIVFNSDQYWIYERLKLQGTRLEVVPVVDLTKEKAMKALRSYRMNYFGEEPSEDVLHRVYDMVGGRLAFLSRAARAEDMLSICEGIYAKEKSWLLSKCWILGEEMDDDVMDQQKYASSAMVLVKALVDKEAGMAETYNSKNGYILPEIPLHEARQIMTRADFIYNHHQIRIFAIDARGMVRADSVPMQRAFREICALPGFDEHLQKTLDRISAIESLGRTKEITLKDLWNNGKYGITIKNAKDGVEKTVQFEVVPKEEDEAD